MKHSKFNLIIKPMINLKFAVRIVQDACLSEDNPIYLDSVCEAVGDCSNDRPGCRLSPSPRCIKLGGDLNSVVRWRVTPPRGIPY